MGKVVVAGRKRKRETPTWLEKKMKKENKRKKQARAEIESLEKRKEELEKKEEEEQRTPPTNEYEIEIEIDYLEKVKKRFKKMKKHLENRKKQACAEIEKVKKMTKQLEKKKKQTCAEIEFLEKKRQQARLASGEQMQKFLDWQCYGLRKADGFDINGFKETTWQALEGEKPNDCPLIVRLYAKIGLHRYNMLEGTNWQLHSIKKYYRKTFLFYLPPSYYITLEAEDPATGSIMPFQISSHEKKKNVLDVRFIVARPGTNPEIFRDPTAPGFYDIGVPKWPSENDKKQFFLVHESELKENDWIRLYLELGFVTTNRRIPDPKLSDLKIVEVMVDTKENVEQPNERLKGFKDATFYIKYYQDLGEGQVCNRRAIIRRDVDLRTERMSLKGDYFLETIETDDSEKSSEQHEASEICVSNIVT